MLIEKAGTHEFTDFHFFCGSGGGALGFQQAEHEYRGIKGAFRTLGGIDCDPDCVSDFKRLTGVDATLMDLFDRQQYTDFWGHEPPPDWKEVQPADIRKASQGECPDVIFLSPPCKGFSGLLPAKSASTPKYQALNRLVFRSMQLAMEAYADDLPAAILIENVPRIRSRGSKLLCQVKNLLGMYGYVFHEGVHDCGEIGGLGQTRSRYLLIARNPQKLPSFIYQPKKYTLKSIGEVLKSVPLPGDIERGGAMHRVPKLQWKTWVRLALIPAGKDWRALNEKDTYANIYQIVPWERESASITGAHRPNNGAVSVADPRVENVSGYGNKYKVVEHDAPAPTITGSRIGSGAILYADTKLGYEPRKGAYRVVRWDETAPTVTGSTGAGRSNGISAISDPRINAGKNRFNGGYGVMDWGKPSHAITANNDVRNHKSSVADPRLGCSPRSGSYEVQDWSQPSKTVFASMDVHAGTAAIADPRIPQETESGVWLIISEDGSWHRPITTFEMAMLQGMPSTFSDGSPLVLSGNSDKKWREHIGNMVPPPAACAIATSMLQTMMPNLVFNEWHWDVDGNAIWVLPNSKGERSLTL